MTRHDSWKIEIIFLVLHVLFKNIELLFLGDLI